MEQEKLGHDAKKEEDEAARRLFVLQIVQPGLAAIDGRVRFKRFAPVFAAGNSPRHKSWDAFLVGLAASVGAGISMGFAEALSDDREPNWARTPLDARAGLRPDDGARRKSGTLCRFWCLSSALP